MCNEGGGILFWGINEDTHNVEGMKLNSDEKEKILKGLRSWQDEFDGRLHSKKEFLEVREDPFNPSDATDLYVLRIEAYPECDKTQKNE